MLLGAHCSTAGGLVTALDRARRIGADSCQLFVKNNMQWLARPLKEEEAANFRAAAKASGLAWIFAHAGYLINLAAPDSANRQKSIRSLIQELERTAALGLPFLVLHPGAHLGAGEEAGLRQVVRALDEAFEATKTAEVRVALENTAGQGTCLGAELWHWAWVYDRVRDPKRLAICVDTAHLLAAGHDIRSPAGWDRVMAEVDRTVGLDQIVAFHLNDSKAPLGSRVDRHEHIGRGHVGLDGFRHIVNDPRFERHPACLETPKSEDLHEDVENLAVLRSLCRGPGKPPLTSSAGVRQVRPRPRAGSRK